MSACKCPRITAIFLVRQYQQWVSVKPASYSRYSSMAGTCFGYRSVFDHCVADLPRVVNMPAQLYLVRGLPARIDCLVDASPPATRIVWTKNERPIADQGSVAPPLPVLTSSSSRIRTNGRGSLIFRSVETGDEGRYACSGFSPVGAGRSSPPVQVLVRGLNSSRCFLVRSDSGEMK
jgi:hypothetical protein